MRTVVAALLAVAATSAVADPKKTLIGKRDTDVVACAGAPDQMMTLSDGSQIMTFRSSRFGAKVFGGGFVGGRETSCTAVVHLRKGRVVKIDLQKRGAILGREIECGRVLQGCE